MEKILLLGASGSIGRQTLAIIQQKPHAFSLVGFSVGNRSESIPEIIAQFPSVSMVYLLDQNIATHLAKRYPHIHFFAGEEGLAQIVTACDFSLLVNALVGFVGLEPTLLALENNRDVALANKEALVVGGAIINQLLAKSKGKIFPIDSEHVALSKCLAGSQRDQVQRLVLTASGGPFRTYSLAQLANVTIDEALHHPSWSMGAKITIDSATMMNKGFEIIEAYYLFNFPLRQIDVVIHPESRIHSLVEFKDGSFLADLGPTSMAIPIAHALYHGKRPIDLELPRLGLREFNTLHFEVLDEERFPAIALAKDALTCGGVYPAVLNAANEEAVYAFLAGKIAFNQIIPLVQSALAAQQPEDALDYPALKRIDQQTRTLIRKQIGN